MPEISTANQMPCWHFDVHPGVATLDMLAKRGRGVKIELVTHSNGELEESDFEAFGVQCGKFTKSICGICHDRFIIVDHKEIFWTGASLKDAGCLTFAVAKMYPPSEVSCEAGSMRGARRSSPGFLNQSARRHQNSENTAKARRRYEVRARKCRRRDAEKLQKEQ